MKSFLFSNSHFAEYTTNRCFRHQKKAVLCGVRGAIVQPQAGRVADRQEMPQVMWSLFRRLGQTQRVKVKYYESQMVKIDFK